MVQSSVAIRACPRCGNEKTRSSLKKINDGLLKILFCKFYRCHECRYRFSVMNPLRLVIFVGILLVLVPILGAVWMASNQRSNITTTAQPLSYDQIKDLAEKGDAEAELKMGLRHASIAWGVKDDRIAAQWFERAARKDQVEAQYRYGLALLEGQGIVQDYKTAFYWLEKAAQRGHALAQSTIGEMYHSGIAIKSDSERAYLWFNLAAAQGVESAASARDLVVKLLTPNQIAAMQEEAGRISRGYISSFVADESKTAVKDSAPVAVDKTLAGESMQKVKEAVARRLSEN
jgi:hypothetical protein